jgi:hypothetical protein
MSAHALIKRTQQSIGNFSARLLHTLKQTSTRDRAEYPHGLTESELKSPITTALRVLKSTKEHGYGDDEFWGIIDQVKELGPAATMQQVRDWIFKTFPRFEKMDSPNGFDSERLEDYRNAEYAIDTLWFLGESLERWLNKSDDAPEEPDDPNKPKAPCELSVSGIAEFIGVSDSTIRAAHDEIGLNKEYAGKTKIYTVAEVKVLAEKRAKSAQFKQEERDKWNALLAPLGQLPVTKSA